VAFGVAEVERVHHQADVGRVLAGHAQVRDFDHLERRLVHGGFELLVALPVAVGLLDHDRALQQQALQNPADVELVILGVAHAERHVLEVAKHRQNRRAMTSWIAHVVSRAAAKCGHYRAVAGVRLNSDFPQPTARSGTP
jgi:hypothetical protein